MWVDCTWSLDFVIGKRFCSWKNLVRTKSISVRPTSSIICSRFHRKYMLLFTRCRILFKHYNTVNCIGFFSFLEWNGIPIYICKYRSSCHRHIILLFNCELFKSFCFHRFNSSRFTNWFNSNESMAPKQTFDYIHHVMHRRWRLSVFFFLCHG